MDMPLGSFPSFTIYDVLTLHEFLAYDWSMFLCLKRLLTKLELLCSDMTGPLQKVTFFYTFCFVSLLKFWDFSLLSKTQWDNIFSLLFRQFASRWTSTPASFAMVTVAYFPLMSFLALYSPSSSTCPGWWRSPITSLTSRNMARSFWAYICIIK